MPTVSRKKGRDAFHVNLTKNVLHCFVCGAGGTVPDFVAAMGGFSFARSGAETDEVKRCLRQAVPAGPTQLITKKSQPPSPTGFTLRALDTHPLFR